MGGPAGTPLAPVERTRDGLPVFHLELHPRLRRTHASQRVALPSNFKCLFLTNALSILKITEPPSTFPSLVRLPAFSGRESFRFLSRRSQDENQTEKALRPLSSPAEQGRGSLPFSSNDLKELRFRPDARKGWHRSCRAWDPKRRSEVRPIGRDQMPYMRQRSICGGCARWERTKGHASRELGGSSRE